ncbi:MAG: hypothetical protein GXO48_05605 [Chlorobi bacterium]|nr:hypothetical protein [Chlorobiota bacterium]
MDKNSKQNGNDTQSQQEKEKQIIIKLREKLEKLLSGDEGVDVIVEKEKPLLYQVVVMKGDNKEFRNYKQDLLISEAQKPRVPLVVIEVKNANKQKSKKGSSPTTHAILTYSMKALKIKEIYPYLRYGLLIVGEKRIVPRFFTHNFGLLGGFDFAMAMENMDDENEVKRLSEVVKKQIETARHLWEILSKEIKDIKVFQTLVKTE